MHKHIIIFSVISNNLLEKMKLSSYEDFPTYITRIRLRCTSFSSAEKNNLHLNCITPGVVNEMKRKKSTDIDITY